METRGKNRLVSLLSTIVIGTSDFSAIGNRLSLYGREF